MIKQLIRLEILAPVKELSFKPKAREVLQIVIWPKLREDSTTRLRTEIGGGPRVGIGWVNVGLISKLRKIGSKGLFQSKFTFIGLGYEKF